MGGPYGDFGAELGLINGDQRVRCAIVYADSRCQYMTLMREQRGQGQLGDISTPRITQLYPDWRTPAALSGSFRLGREGQQVTLQIELAGALWGWTGGYQSQNMYEQENYRLLALTPEIWVFLPPVIPKGQGFWLGLIWQGQALLRRYDGSGAWVDLTQMQGVLVANSPGQ
ncbi:hypothetical protein GlitD10_1289 [Gloeomargarita lithophora Alchichica-D10]|uniref:Uncharacterized protein n=1 Tax=Gloeomargarita lithophora Alchichica-D10 TaxID=1188229 RepID=A0A1J0ACG0_9CYAN|nr:DUF3598 family protein [Gloeomargarita lithophora]APB33610.1 hypothetical protein GlitD10_1289 [Gloeomargarita lithophora Alchichica-D10]